MLTIPLACNFGEYIPMQSKQLLVTTLSSVRICLNVLAEVTKFYSCSLFYCVWGMFPQSFTAVWLSLVKFLSSTMLPHIIWYKTVAVWNKSLSRSDWNQDSAIDVQCVRAARYFLIFIPCLFIITVWRNLKKKKSNNLSILFSNTIWLI